MGSKVTVTSGSGEDMSVRRKATSIDPNFPSAFGKAKNKYMKDRGLDNILIAREERQERRSRVSKLLEETDVDLLLSQAFYNDQQARQDAALIEARRRRVNGTTNKHGMVVADRETIEQKAARLSESWLGG